MRRLEAEQLRSEILRVLPAGYTCDELLDSSHIGTGPDGTKYIIEEASFFILKEGDDVFDDFLLHIQSRKTWREFRSFMRAFLPLMRPDKVELMFEERVEKGLAYLDLYESGWGEKIDLETLDAYSPWNCVLGQITGKNYRHYLDSYLSDSQAVALGFSLRGHTATHGRGDGMSQEEIDAAWNSVCETERAEFASLTQAWKQAIEKRRVEEQSHA